MQWRNQTDTQNITLIQHAATVDNILQGLGINPGSAQIPTANGYGWRFQWGTATIEIYISVHDQYQYFQVLAPIITLPTSNLLPFYRRMLELNLQLTNASFGVYQDIVFIFSERQLQGLDQNEAEFLITMVAQYADQFDDDLVNEFGGRLYSQV